MIALIDGDLVAYRCAASCQKQGVVVEDFDIAQARADNLLHNILAAVEATECIIYLSGGENFRKTICPSYKANRDDVERPAYLEPLREYLVVKWGAKITDGIEADDALGIAQTAGNHYLRELDGEGNQIIGHTTVICSLDKDLRQVPGHHYSWEILGTSSSGKQWKKEAQQLYVSEQEGLFNFYWQIVMGDASDNVPGYDGKMRQKVPKFLEPHYENMQVLETEQELCDYVRAFYALSNEEFLINGTCLWVQRYEGEDWRQKGKQLLERCGMGETGQKDAFEPSSLQPSEQVAEDGNLNTTL